MTTRRGRIIQRVGVIAAAALVVGGSFTGLAFAADGDGGSTSSNTSGSGGSLVQPLEDVIPSASLPDSSALDPISSVISTLTSIIPTVPTGSSTSPSGPSGLNTQIIYSPYPFPVYGDFGHRSYGKYRDSDCGCDRYAAPTYKAPNYVATTQVASVPKGGVDTGDGSFQ